MSIANVLDVLERPRLIELRPRLHALVFDLVKIVAARHILRTAKTLGQIHQHTHVFESTSGSMGLALALACRELGLPLTIVGDPAIDPPLRARLEALGVQVSIVTRPCRCGGLQARRIERLKELMRHSEHAFWTHQYDNPAAREAYHPIAVRLCEQLPRLDVLVVGVGSGASACGLAGGCEALGHPVRLVAVDTHGSVLFGQRDKPRLLRGVGNSILPANLLHESVDECHWVSAGEAFAATRMLYDLYAVDAGPSAGAAYLVAEWLVRRQGSATVAFVCPDGGERYRRVVYLDRPSTEPGVPAEPVTVRHPRDCSEGWTHMEWKRRRLVDVLARSSRAPTSELSRDDG